MEGRMVEENRVMERNQMMEENQALWLGGLSRVKLWLGSVAFTGPSKSRSCPHPGICRCLGASSHRCTLEHPVGHMGSPVPPFFPPSLPGTPRTRGEWLLAGTGGTAWWVV